MSPEEKKTLDEKISALYYTATEARAALGMNRDMFNYWVRVGRIKKRSLLGGKHGVYPKKEIDSLAAEIEATLMADAPDPLIFRRATLEDIEKEEHLAYQVFGQASAAPELKTARRAYLQSSPDSFWHLYDQDRLVASINLFPLQHAAYEQFRHGKRGWTYDIAQIERFAPGHPLECIIIDFLSTPVVSPQRRKQYSARILSELGKLLTDWARMGIEIAKVAAASATPTGQHILTHAGFQVIYDSGHNRLIYELDVESSNIKMLAGYKEALTEWKAAHPTEKVTAPPVSTTPPPMKKRSESPVRVQETVSTTEGLPDGLIGWRAYARSIGIAESTVQKAIARGDVHPIAGPWKVGKIYVQSALDEQGRADVDKLKKK